MLETFRQAVLFLLDKSKPFDQEKVKILDQISDNLYGKDHQMVSSHFFFVCIYVHNVFKI